MVCRRRCRSWKETFSPEVDQFRTVAHTGHSTAQTNNNGRVRLYAIHRERSDSFAVRKNQKHENYEIVDFGIFGWQ